MYKILIFPVVPYGYETWLLVLREEHGLRVFENRALRRIFGLKRDGTIGGWRILGNEELHNRHSSQNKIKTVKSRMMRLAEQVACMRGTRNILQSFDGNAGRIETIRKPYT
jgi:hypothetical protein